jgi:hypothetical protein
LPTTLATGSDFCNNTGLAFTYLDSDTTGEDCSEYIVRTHYAQDICGNVATCTQRIYLVDTTPPDIVCPADMTLECHLPVPYVPATATDDCHDIADITYSDEVIPQECANNVFVDGEKKVLFLIVRTHYATDECCAQSSAHGLLPIIAAMV